MKFKVRPSGAIVMKGVTVKIYPDEKEAAHSVMRHQANTTAAVEIHSRTGNCVVMETGASMDGFTLSDIKPQLEAVWGNDNTEGFVSVKADAYLKYVLRNRDLPAVMSDEVLRALESDIFANGPTAKQIHGDLTPDNVLMTYTGYRLIDFSIREEMPYRESDLAKWYFHMYRTKSILFLSMTPLEKFFFACHFCRVWTRDVEDRPNLERSFNEYITRI